MFIMVFVFTAGVLLGAFIRDSRLTNIALSQKERGDYWFDKYMTVVNAEWEPLSRSFNKRHEM